VAERADASHPGGPSAPMPLGFLSPGDRSSACCPSPPARLPRSRRQIRGQERGFNDCLDRRWPANGSSAWTTIRAERRALAICRRPYWAVVGKPKEGATVLAHVSGIDKKKAPSKNGIDAVIVRSIMLRPGRLHRHRQHLRWRFKQGDKDHHRFWSQLIPLGGQRSGAQRRHDNIRFGVRDPSIAAIREVEMLARLGDKRRSSTRTVVERDCPQGECERSRRSHRLDALKGTGNPRPIRRQAGQLERAGGRSLSAANNRLPDLHTADAHLAPIGDEL